MAVSSAVSAAQWESPLDADSNTPSSGAPFNLAVSLPIGLNRDAPNLGVFLLVVYEFPAARLVRRKLSLFPENTSTAFP
jgi:hypothetical protein